MTPGIEQAIDLAGGQRELADLLGVSQQAVSKMKTNGYAPLGHAKRIVELFGTIPLRELVAPELRELAG